jgi:hypothetical protein
VPAGGLLKGSRSSSRQHALHAVSAAHTAAARWCGGAATLCTRPGTQLARTRGDPAAGGGLRINHCLMLCMYASVIMAPLPHTVLQLRVSRGLWGSTLWNRPLSAEPDRRTPSAAHRRSRNTRRTARTRTNQQPSTPWLQPRCGTRRLLQKHTRTHGAHESVNRAGHVAARRVQDPSRRGRGWAVRARAARATRAAAREGVTRRLAAVRAELAGRPSVPRGTSCTMRTCGELPHPATRVQCDRTSKGAC